MCENLWELFKKKKQNVGIEYIHGFVNPVSPTIHDQFILQFLIPNLFHVPFDCFYINAVFLLRSQCVAFKLNGYFKAQLTAMHLVPGEWNDSQPVLPHPCTF